MRFFKTHRTLIAAVLSAAGTLALVLPEPARHIATTVLKALGIVTGLSA